MSLEEERVIIVTLPSTGLDRDLLRDTVTVWPGVEQSVGPNLGPTQSPSTDLTTSRDDSLSLPGGA